MSNVERRQAQKIALEMQNNYSYQLLLTSGIPALHDIPAPTTTKIFSYTPSLNDSAILSNVILSDVAEENVRPPRCRLCVELDFVVMEEVCKNAREATNDNDVSNAESLLMVPV